MSVQIVYNYQGIEKALRIIKSNVENAGFNFEANVSKNVGGPTKIFLCEEKKETKKRLFGLSSVEITKKQPLAIIYLRNTGNYAWICPRSDAKMNTILEIMLTISATWSNNVAVNDQQFNISAIVITQDMMKEKYSDYHG